MRVRLREGYRGGRCDWEDRRGSGGSPWVIGGPELSGLMDSLAARNFQFVFSDEGGRATRHRPGWWIRE